MSHEKFQAHPIHLAIKFWELHAGYTTDLTIEETAELYGVGPKTVKEWIRRQSDQVFLDDNECIAVIPEAMLTCGAGSARDHGLVNMDGSDPIDSRKRKRRQLHPENPYTKRIQR